MGISHFPFFEVEMSQEIYAIRHARTKEEMIEQLKRDNLELTKRVGELLTMLYERDAIKDEEEMSEFVMRLDALKNMT